MTESIILLLVGLTVFMVGMEMMSNSLKKLAGKGLRSLFKKIEDKKLAGFGIGLSVTAIIQSSSATSVMVIGFLNAGVLTLLQGVCIMMGAYVGTSVTGLIVSLSSFKITPYLIGLAFIGLAMTLFKNKTVKMVGGLLCGLGIVFFGLQTMSGVFSGESEIKTFFTNLFGVIDFPLLLLLIGLVFTIIVQSSSATSGIVIMLAASGAIPYISGLYIILGATIGTITTTVLGSLNGATDSKRLAASCLVMRIFTALVAMAILWIVEAIAPNSWENLFIGMFHNAGLATAMFDIFYNIIFMLALLPAAPLFEKAGKWIIKDKKGSQAKKALQFVDNKMLAEPAIAEAQSKKELLGMMDLSFANLNLTYTKVFNQSNANDDEIESNEDKIDSINEALTPFLIQLSNEADDRDAKRIGSFFHVTNDLERIGDHAYNLYEMANDMMEKDLKFSEEAKKEFDTIYEIIQKMNQIVPEIFDKKDKRNLKKLHDLEEETDQLTRDYSEAHYQRIKKGEVKIELSPYYTSMLSNLERIADHMVNVGYSIVDPTGADEGEKKKLKTIA